MRSAAVEKTLLLLLLFCMVRVAHAGSVSCSIQRTDNTAAGQSFAQRQYAKALDLYAADVKKNPGDLRAMSGEVRALLMLERVDDAARLAESTVQHNPKSAEATNVLGEVRFRQGRLGDAVAAFNSALQIDPCMARNRYDVYRLLRVESMRRSAYEQLIIAHQLSPDDPNIHLAWIENLPLRQRAAQLKGYLASPGVAVDHRQELNEYSERLEASLAAKHNGCRVTPTSPAATELPFRYILHDAYRFSGMGFDVTVNNKAKSLLELDTGASGILLNRGTAKKAGLVPVVTSQIEGLGDQKAMSGYWAYADDLRIGSLEFKNCMVQVSDKRSLVNTDGLIGADVFENYLVRLDFPTREMSLTPLPSPPGQVRAAQGSLNASGVGSAAAHSAEASKATAGNAAASDAAVAYTDRYVSPEMKDWSPFARFGHQILINGQLKDKTPRLFLLDSGANISILSIAAAKSVGKIHVDSMDRLSGLNGQVKKLYTAPHVDLVFAGLRDPLRDVLIMDLGGLSSANGTEVSGIVGLDTMKMLIVKIDYRDGLIDIVYDSEHGSNVLNKFSGTN